MRSCRHTDKGSPDRLFVNESGKTGLWRSDGTEKGTVRVSAVFPFGNLTTVQDTLFFSAAGTRSAGLQLWKSDGSEAGTVEVSDIEYASSNVAGPSNLTNVGGTLFFTLQNGELWKSDGTTAGTGPFKFVAATAAPTQTASVTATFSATATPLPSQTQLTTPRPTSTPAPVLCIGDCGGIGVVGVSDIITLVNIALGNAHPPACPHGRTSGTVDIALIITAVNNALHGCGAS